MVNLIKELKILEAKYASITSKTITLATPELQNYISNYLFSIKDETKKNMILRIFSYYLLADPEVSFRDVGVSYKLVIKTNTNSYLELILVGSSVGLCFGENNPIWGDTEEMIECLTESLFPLHFE